MYLISTSLNIFIVFREFNRVLPLPSQAWTDMYNMWSCCSHNHSENGDGKKTKTG